MDRADKFEKGFVIVDLEFSLSIFTIYRYGTSENKLLMITQEAQY